MHLVHKRIAAKPEHCGFIGIDGQIQINSQHKVSNKQNPVVSVAAQTLSGLASLRLCMYAL